MINLLCVATLEPRKNHARLLDAYARLRARRPDLPLRLTLVGNRYAGAPGVADLVETAAQKDNSIVWRGFLRDAEIAALYDESRFSIYPSLVEGFGLPILESLWMGRTCLCHNNGVMAELAADGGCLTVDMRDVEAISAALETLATDDACILSFEEEARSRQISSWREYAVDVANEFVAASMNRAFAISTPETHAKSSEAIEQTAISVRRRLKDASVFADRYEAQGGSSANSGGRPSLENRGLFAILRNYARERSRKNDLFGRAIIWFASLRRKLSRLVGRA